MLNNILAMDLLNLKNKLAQFFFLLFISTLANDVLSQNPEKVNEEKLEKIRNLFSNAEYQKSLNFLDSVEPELCENGAMYSCIEAKIIRSNALRILKRFDESGESLKEIELLSERHLPETHYLRAMFYESIAYLNMQGNPDLENAEKWVNRSLEIAEFIEDAAVRSKIYMIHGFLLDELGKYTDAINAYHYAIRVIGEVNTKEEKTALSLIHNNLGVTYITIGEPDSALFHYEQNFKLISEFRLPNHRDFAINYSNR
ncbi:MAG: hypothetical protein ACFCU6_03070, partial [Balneolaceae bacterium]